MYALKPSIVAHTLISRIWKAEAESSQEVCSPPGLYSETLSQKKSNLCLQRNTHGECKANISKRLQRASIKLQLEYVMWSHVSRYIYGENEIKNKKQAGIHRAVVQHCLRIYKDP